MATTSKTRTKTNAKAGKATKPRQTKHGKPSPVGAQSQAGERLTVRVRACQALAKAKGPLTSAQVQAALQLGHSLTPTLQQAVQAGLLANAAGPNGQAAYKLTAAGSKALKQGTVNAAGLPALRAYKAAHSKGKAAKPKAAKAKPKAAKPKRAPRKPKAAKAQTAS